MTIDDLKPHILSRLAHEFKLQFLDALPIDIKNRLLSNGEYISSTFNNPDISNQAAPKYEPDILMDELYKVASNNGHSVIAKETVPKGHFYTHMTTSSCNVIIVRRNSRNTSKSNFFADQAFLNYGLMEPQQPDLLDDIVLQNDETPLSSLLFVYASVYWDREMEMLDFEFILPHPTEFRPLMVFSLDELRTAAKKPMTDIAGDDIVSFKKRIDQVVSGG